MALEGQNAVPQVNACGLLVICKGAESRKGRDGFGFYPHSFLIPHLTSSNLSFLLQTE